MTLQLSSPVPTFHTKLDIPSPPSIHPPIHPPRSDPYATCKTLCKLACQASGSMVDTRYWTPPPVVPSQSLVILVRRHNAIQPRVWRYVRSMLACTYF